MSVAVQLPSAPRFTASPQQQAIFDAITHGTGHLVVLARAGTGKTTTICEAIRRIPSDMRVLVCAFNKSIATELGERIAATNVDVSTLHSYGLRALKRAWGPGVRPETDVRAERALIDSVSPAWLDYDGRESLRDVLSRAKATLSTTPAEITECAVACGFDFPSLACDVIPVLLEQALVKRSGISFDDMVYVPATLGFSAGKYDFVFVDETQDMNRSQLRLASKALARGGRVVVVGDDRQAIYGFRGADCQAIDRIRTALDATVLPLTVSRRCPKTVGLMAREYVPDFEVLESAPEGTTATIAHIDAETLRPGDFVLSRTNAPLVRGCLAALRAGIPAYVQGKDIGKKLAGIVRKSRQDTIEGLCAWLRSWSEREQSKALKLGNESKAQEIADTAELLRSLATDSETITELTASIESLFLDTNPGGRVMFSTVHKAKGLETDRVFVLRSTWFRGVGTTCVDPDGDSRSNVEEQNLFYVAITRAKRELYLVQSAECV